MAEKQIVLLSPVGQVAPTAAAVPSPRLSNLQGKVAGLLDDRMSTSDHFLQRVGELLVERCDVDRLVAKRKPTPTLGSPPELLGELMRDCDFVVVGCGT